MPQNTDSEFTESNQQVHIGTDEARRKQDFQSPKAHGASNWSSQIVSFSVVNPWCTRETSGDHSTAVLGVPGYRRINTLSKSLSFF